MAATQLTPNNIYIYLYMYIYIHIVLMSMLIIIIIATIKKNIYLLIVKVSCTIVVIGNFLSNIITISLINIINIVFTTTRIH